MKIAKLKIQFVLAMTVAMWCGTIMAQGPVTGPPSGGNQKASVTQYMGLVSVTVTYNSPDITGPDGVSRAGKIWGELVPYGMNNLGFGTAKESPWRAGANENTVITVSHDLQVEGKDLPAGTYGLHMIAEPEQWTIIFNKVSTAWGSFFYEPSEDVLRVKVKPVNSDFKEWLSYSFEDRKLESTTLTMEWDNLKVPIKFSADVNNIYLKNIRQELQSTKGFSWQGWQSAANFCVQNDINLEEALEWADRAINTPFGIGVENFTTLDTKAQVLDKLGRSDEAEALMAKAIEHPTASMSQLHFYGRRLITEGKNEQAMEVFELNRKRNPEDNFTTFVGLARGYEAVGKNKKAIEHYRLAAQNAPAGQASYYEGLAKQLEEES
jgi:hypothetical protein